MSIRKDVAMIAALFALCILCLVISAAYLYQRELATKPLIWGYVESGRYQDIIEAYVAARPNLEDQPYLGNPDADLTMVVYLDPLAVETKAFMSVLFPIIDTEFLKSGRLRLYIKPVFSMDDLKGNTERYQYAKAADCLQKREEGNAMSFLVAVVNTSEKIDSIISRLEGDPLGFGACMQKSPSQNILEQVTEHEHFATYAVNPKLFIGINGENYQVLEGIPSEDVLALTIKNQLILLGE